MTCELTWSCESKTPDVNLGKLVLLEVHDRVENAKIAKKYFSMLKWGVPYTVGKLKRRAFQQAKEMPIKYLFREIRPQKISRLKVRNFLECPRATPTTPRGGSCRGLQKHMYGGTSPNGGEKPLLVLLELAGKPLTQITNRKLDWVLGASTDVQAWIISCLAPD